MKKSDSLSSNLIKGDSLEVLRKSIKSNSIHMILTSPPYDDLRSYLNAPSFTFDVFKKCAKEFYRVLAKGGVLVWVVGDSTINGSETGTSFRQALYFKEIGFNLHDTMIYKKDSFAFPSKCRYHQTFEYMFVFSKGKPRVFNPIKDRPNKHKGKFLRGTDRQRDGTTTISHGVKAKKKIDSHGMRQNVWEFSPGYNRSASSRIAFEHPAIFPEELAIGHIQSWTNEGDVVLDPFMGSGTTGWACKKLKRRFVGIEIIQKYFDISAQRLAS